MTRRHSAAIKRLRFRHARQHRAEIGRDRGIGTRVDLVIPKRPAVESRAMVSNSSASSISRTSMSYSL